MRRTKPPHADPATPEEYLENAEYHQGRADYWNKVSRISLGISVLGFGIAIGSTVAGILTG